MIRRLWRTIGPGFITGAADDDPSGIVTYAIAGATGGLSLLWVALLTMPLMSVVQETCARIAIVERRGLTAALLARFPSGVVIAIVATVVAANTLNIAADLSGMAAVARLVVGVGPPWLYVILFGSALLFTIVRLPYGSLDLIAKVLCLALLAYPITAIIVHPDWLNVLHALVVPEVHLDAGWLALLVGFLGTTITPYLFLWQAAQEVEELDATGESVATAVSAARRDTVRGIAFSNIVTASIVITAASTLHAAGKTIKTAADAASSLRPLAGDAAYLLFALGMIGAGILAIPVLAASSGYALAECFHWPSGLNKRFAEARGFYATIGAGMIAGMVLVLFGVDPIAVLFFSAVVNGFVAVPLLIMVTIVGSDRRAMGTFTTPKAVTVISWITVGLMALAAIALVWTSR